MAKKASGARDKDAGEKPILPREKVAYITGLLESGDPEKIREINRMILQYRFSDERITEILMETPIDKILKIDLEVLNPKIVVRILACCARNMRETEDKKFKYKTQRIMEIACNNLHRISFGTEEFKELAEIDDPRVSEYVESVSNDWNIQDKVFLPRDRVADVVRLLESGSGENLKKINELIVQYKFSEERLAEIIREAPMESLLKVNEALLHPKVVVRVIACCVKTLKKGLDINMKNKFRQVLDVAIDKLYSVDLGREEYLELARIENEKVLNFAVLSNHFEVRDQVSRTASGMGIAIEAG